MSRSRKKGAPFSLFAFQDAITSVCGVVVLITLLLAVQLTSRTIESELETEPDDSLAERAAELREEIAEAREALDAVPTPRISFDASKPYAGLSAVDLRAKVSELDARLESARAELERAKSELPREESGAPSEEESTKELAALREELKRAEEEASAKGIRSAFSRSSRARAPGIGLSSRSNSTVIARKARERYSSSTSRQEVATTRGVLTSESSSVVTPKPRLTF